MVRAARSALSSCEAAQSVDAPIYLHPNTPPRTMIGPLLEAGLDRVMYAMDYPYQYVPEEVFCLR